MMLDSSNPTPFANINGKSFKLKPYNNQHKIPVTIMRYMYIDKSPADLVLQVLTACGTNAPVVSVAAIKPSKVVPSIICSFFGFFGF